MKHSFGSDWQDLEVWYRKAGRNLYYDDFDPNFQRDVLDNLIDYVKNPRHPYPKEKKLSVWQKKYALNSREAFSEKQLVKMAVDGKQPPKSWWDKMYNKILKSQKRKSRRKEGKYSLKANRHPELIKAKARQITGFQWHVNMVLKKNPKTGKPYFK